MGFSDDYSYNYRLYYDAVISGIQKNKLKGSSRLNNEKKNQISKIKLTKFTPINQILLPKPPNA